MKTSTRPDIRYRTFGDGGPKIVLLHGGMQTSANFTRLATELAGDFTVYVPDRNRGDLRSELDGLAALLDETGAGNVFGLSSGAVVALHGALTLTGIERLALYEPPIRYGDHDPLAWLPRYEKELAAGRTVSALVTVSKGTGDFPYVPRAALQPLLRLWMRADPQVRELVPTMRQDAAVVAQAAGPLDRYSAVTAETLLLGGERSAAYLKQVLSGLEPVLPHVRRVTLSGVGHVAADNHGKPELVAAELRKFFR